MAIPDYESCMLPLLKLAGDKAVHRFQNACEGLAKHFSLTDDELRQLLPSGRYPVFRSRVGWAKTYLSKAGLLVLPARGNFQITDRGLQALQKNPSRIDSAFLSQYPEFNQFQQRPVQNSDSNVAPATSVDTQRTPEELMEYAYSKLQTDLAQELLDQIMRMSPAFFERLVVDLLVAMGYGGSHKDAATVVGKSGDGGIDGIIKQDRLGLDNIYVQAKRWGANQSVGRPEVQAFVGALSGNAASKGVFITTSKFSETAMRFLERVPQRVILLDGETLARYMIEFNIGVSPRETYVVKRLDSDYFEEEV